MQSCTSVTKFSTPTRLGPRKHLCLQPTFTPRQTSKRKPTQLGSCGAGPEVHKAGVPLAWSCVCFNLIFWGRDAGQKGVKGVKTRLTSRKSGGDWLCPITPALHPVPVCLCCHLDTPVPLPHPHKAMLIPPTPRPSGSACPFNSHPFYLLIFFKSLLNLLQYFFCFMFWFFGARHVGS